MVIRMPIVLLICLVWSGWCQGADRSCDFAEAKAQVSTNGKDIGVFLYGSDWMRAGSEWKQDIWDSDRFSKAVGDTVTLLAVDHPEGVARRAAHQKLLARLKQETGLPALVMRAVSQGGAVLTVQTNGALLVTGKTPAQDVYRLDMAPVEFQASALRIDILTDPSLPHHGPGRARNGNFAISEIEAVLMNGAVPQSVSWVAGWVDSIHKPQEGIQQAIDGRLGRDTYWNGGGHKRHRPLRVVLVPKQPFLSGQRVRLKIHSVSKHAAHALGHFRMSWIGDPTIADQVRHWYAPLAAPPKNTGLPCSSINYPALFLLDSEGRLCAERHGLSLADSLEDVSAWIRSKQAMRMDRDRLWKEAELLKGVERAKRLGQGLRLMGLKLGRRVAYQAVRDEIQALDKEHGSHVARPFTLDSREIRKHALLLRTQEGLEQAIAYLDKQLKHPGNAGLSAGQRQGLLMIQYNLFRGQPDYAERLHEMLRKSAELDPLSPTGYGCAGKYLMAVGPPSLRYGWAERHCATNAAPVWRIGGRIEPLHRVFPKAGAYDVVLDHIRGAALSVEKVSLWVGDRKVAQVAQIQPLSAIQKTTRYRLTVPKLDEHQDMELRIGYRTSGKSDGALRVVDVRAPVAAVLPSGRHANELLAQLTQLEAALRQQRKRMGGDVKVALKALAVDQGYVDRLLRYKALHLAGADKLELVIATRHGAEFLDMFLKDREWMMMWLCCGPRSKDPALELKYLASLWKHDPSLETDPVFKRLATAISVAGGGDVSKYDYFKESHQVGRLHRMFYEHPTWLMRFILSISPEDGRFLRDIINKPIQTYGNIHYQAGYRRHSIFGDSIHGPHFFKPWTGLPKMQRIKYAGGVCGSLTSFAEMMYKSHGIPSQGMSEPGHRSYVVRTGPGHWQPRYSMKNPKRTRSFYGGTYEYLGVMEKVWADLDAVHRASIHLWQAQLYGSSSGKMLDEEASAYDLALDAHPLFIDAWQISIDRLKKDPEQDHVAWSRLTSRLAEDIKPLGGETFYDLWSRYEAQAVKDLSKAQLQAECKTLSELVARVFPKGCPKLTAALDRLLVKSVTKSAIAP